MSRPTVYLAGPINEFTSELEKASQWRHYAIERLKTFGIVGVDPMRGETERLEDFEPMRTDKAIIGRDYHDCVNCDLVIANYIGAHRISAGTAMECAWRYALNKNVVAVIEPSGNPNDHEMLRESWTYRVEHLDSALSIAAWMLYPYQ